MSVKLDEVVEKLVKQLPGVPKEEIEKRLRVLVGEFKVPVSEAVRSVINYARRNYKIEAPLAKVAELEPGASITLRAKVVRIYDSKGKKAKIVGLLGDETGVVRFVITGDAEVQEGKSYEFRNVYADVGKGGRMTLLVTKLSEVREIDEDVEVRKPYDIEFEGAVVAVQKNSGLVQRCRQCGRVSSRGICPAHGKTETEEVVRAKIVIDNGEEVVQAVLNEELTTKLTGLSRDELEKIKAELGREATYDAVASKLVGRYVRVVGNRGTRYLVAAQAEVVA